MRYAGGRVVGLQDVVHGLQEIVVETGAGLDGLQIEAGLRRVWPKARCVKIPMADGGEGTVQSIRDAGGEAVLLLSVDSPVPADVLATARAVPGVKRVMALAFA